MSLDNQRKSAKARLKSIDKKLLKRQAGCIGNLMDRMEDTVFPVGDKRKGKLLRGVWNLLHAILDDLEAGKKCTLEAR